MHNEDDSDSEEPADHLFGVQAQVPVETTVQLLRSHCALELLGMSHGSMLLCQTHKSLESLSTLANHWHNKHSYTPLLPGWQAVLLAAGAAVDVIETPQSVPVPVPTIDTVDGQYCTSCKRVGTSKRHLEERHKVQKAERPCNKQQFKKCSVQEVRFHVYWRVQEQFNLESWSPGESAHDRPWISKMLAHQKRLAQEATIEHHLEAFDDERLVPDFLKTVGWIKMTKGLPLGPIATLADLPKRTEVEPYAHYARLEEVVRHYGELLKKSFDRVPRLVRCHLNTDQECVYPSLWV